MANQRQPLRNRHFTSVAWGASITSPDVIVTLCANGGSVIKQHKITADDWLRRDPDSRMAFVAGIFSQLAQSAPFTTHGRIDGGLAGGGPMVRFAA